MDRGLPMSFATRIVRLVLTTTAALWGSSAAADPAEMRKLAHEYYEWQEITFPVNSSARGDHRYDDRMNDQSPQAIQARRQHVAAVLDKVKALSTEGWNRDDRIDAMLLRAQLEGADFFGRRVDPTATDPQTY